MTLKFMSFMNFLHALLADPAEEAAHLEKSTAYLLQSLRSMKVYGERLFKVSKTGQYLNPKNWPWQPVHINWFRDPSQFYVKNSFEVFGRNNFTLVISQRDIQTGALLKTLKQMKRSYVFVDWDTFSQKGGIHLSNQKSYLSFKNIRTSPKSFVKIDLSKVRSVYYSTPDLIEAQYDTSNNFSMSEKLYINRWAESLQSLESVLNKAKWVPARPSQLTSLSQKKFLELNVAKKLGLNIPQTIFTNDLKEARKFLKNKKVLLREFGRRVFTDRKNQFRQIELKILNNTHPASMKSLRTKMKNSRIEDLRLIKNAPCVFQEYIEKKFEVRAVVVSKKVFSCKIDSQKNNKSSVDWRNQEGSAPFTAFELPKQIQKKLIKMQKALGFELSCFDLIYSVDKKFYFLEMNRPGSWLFIEALTGLQIRKEIGRALVNRV